MMTSTTSSHGEMDDVEEGRDINQNNNGQDDDDDDDVMSLPSSVQQRHQENILNDIDNALTTPFLTDYNNNTLLRQRITATPTSSSPSPSSSSPPFRILDREAPFHQSRGRWGIQRLSRRIYQNNPCRCISRLWENWVVGDWFHRLAHQRTCVLMFVLFVAYSSIVVFFAFVYLAVSLLGRKYTTEPDGSINLIAFCDMDINDHMEALYFSFSTMTTIGYGVSDYYFGGCWTPLLLVLWQVCTAITFDAVAVGLILQRMSRGRKRGRTITFSDKAVITRIRGIPYFMFRIGELRQYNLIAETVRVYCIRHERLPVENNDNNLFQHHQQQTNTTTAVPIETTNFVAHEMKLVRPNQESGSSHVFLSLPQMIVHRIDDESPLMPPSPIWYNVHGQPCLKRCKASVAFLKHDDDDCKNDNNDNNDSISSLQAALESCEIDCIKQEREITAFGQDRNVEVIVFVEGTDEGTGSATQARHSYKQSDMVWNHTFESCVHPIPTQQQEQGRNNYNGWFSFTRQSNNHDSTISTTNNNYCCSIDFASFHNVRPTPMNCQSSPYI